MAIIKNLNSYYLPDVFSMIIQGFLVIIVCENLFSGSKVGKSFSKIKEINSNYVIPLFIFTNALTVLEYSDDSYLLDSFALNILICGMDYTLGLLYCFIFRNPKEHQCFIIKNCVFKDSLYFDLMVIEIYKFCLNSLVDMSVHRVHGMALTFFLVKIVVITFIKNLKEQVEKDFKVGVENDLILKDLYPHIDMINIASSDILSEKDTYCIETRKFDTTYSNNCENQKLELQIDTQTSYSIFVSVLYNGFNLIQRSFALLCYVLSLLSDNKILAFIFALGINKFNVIKKWLTVNSFLHKSFIKPLFFQQSTIIQLSFLSIAIFHYFDPQRFIMDRLNKDNNQDFKNLLKRKIRQIYDESISTFQVIVMTGFNALVAIGVAYTLNNFSTLIFEEPISKLTIFLISISVLSNSSTDICETENNSEIILIYEIANIQLKIGFLLNSFACFLIICVLNY